MKNVDFNRRKFIKDTAADAAGLMILSVLSKDAQAAARGFFPKIYKRKKPSFEGSARIKFSVIGVNHGHIFSMIESVLHGGGELVSFYIKEPDLLADFSTKYPKAKQAKSEQEILEDASVQLILSSIIPVERAPLGIRVMQHGKDYLVDKPGMVTLEQLEEVRQVQKSTKRIYSILYSERLENKATVKAGEMVKSGAIGKVIQTIGLGPHRMNPATRPAWFFDLEQSGGILTDIASHQFDQFLFFTNSTHAAVIAAQVGNANHKEHPSLEDFGDALLNGNGGAGYLRVDWFTPGGLATWGDARLTVLGTEGYIEVRKNIDIGGRRGENHLFLVNQKETRYVDCNNEPLPFGDNLVDDVLNRTETAMSQEHCFLAMELALKAQKQAKTIHFDVRTENI